MDRLTSQEYVRGADLHCDLATTFSQTRAVCFSVDSAGEASAKWLT